MDICVSLSVSRFGFGIRDCDKITEVELGHVGPCARCEEPIERRCRCGITSTTVVCHEYSSATQEEFLCSAPCPSLRSCGRHQCTTRCCPASSFHHSLASSRSKKKKPVNAGSSGWQEEIERMEREQVEREWHTCDIVCGKVLSCGNHFCEEADHKGVCKPCLRSNFDEVSFLLLPIGVEKGS